MIVLKVYQSWAHVGTLPLFRALILDGATYYFVLALTCGLNIFATMSSEVGTLRFVVPSALHLQSSNIALLSHRGYQVCRNFLHSHHVLTTPIVSLHA